MRTAMAEPTIAEVLRDGAAILGGAGVSTPQLDAEVLLAAVLGVNRAALYARFRDPLPADARGSLADALRRRAAREPVAYITGVHEFWSLPFAVTPDVLIPRPETELLVEAVCGLNPRVVCDIGTGSGCVAVAVACERPAVTVVATDVSPGALAVAAGNAARLGVAERINFVESDLFAALPADAMFDVVVSNPPYVPAGAELAPELGYEPTGALRAGPDGLAVIRRLIAGAPAHLRVGGWLVMEFGDGQADAVRGIAAAAGFGALSVQNDLAGMPRVLVARREQGC